MTSPRYAHLAAKALSSTFRTQEPPPSAEDRDAAIAAVAAAINRRRKRRVLMRAAVVGASAAAAAVAVAFIMSRPANETASPVHPPMTVTAKAESGRPVILTERGPEDLSALRALPAGARVITGEGGRVTLDLSTGTRLRLASQADFKIVDKGKAQRFALSSGSMHAKVAKLATDQRFLVDTPDAQVEVRGTSFRVAVLPESERCSDGGRTRVEVQEGLVAIRQRGELHLVRPGEHWPQVCEQKPESTAVEEPSPPTNHRRARHLHQKHRTRAPAETNGAEASLPEPAEPEAQSDLVEQNDLFAEASALAQSGELRRAAEIFERLLERFPNGPLAESALAERMKTLEKVDPEEAARAARAYRERYPQGFARDEARRILVGPR